MRVGLRFNIEPTNDLDIPTLTILEDYLDSFRGIVIAVSHDRYFLDNLVDRIFAFEGNGVLKQYEGGYTDYYEAKTREDADSEISRADKKKIGTRNWKAKAEAEAALEEKMERWVYLNDLAEQIQAQ